MADEQREPRGSLLPLRPTLTENLVDAPRRTSTEEESLMPRRHERTPRDETGGEG